MTRRILKSDKLLEDCKAFRDGTANNKDARVRLYKTCLKNSNHLAGS